MNGGIPNLVNQLPAPPMYMNSEYMALNLMFEFKQLFRKCLLSLRSGCDHTLHSKIMSFVNSYNIDNVIYEIDNLQIDMDVVLSYDAIDFNRVQELFRRVSDHSLARFVDIAHLMQNSTLLDLLNMLGVPIPDSTIILIAQVCRIEPVLRHLVNLIVDKEDTSKCLAFIKEKYSQTYFFANVAKCTSLLIDKLPKGILFSVVVKTNGRHGSLLKCKGINHLVQLALFYDAFSVVNWISANFPDTKFSKATHLVGIIRSDPEHCVFLSESIYLTCAEVQWIVRYCNPNKLKMCLDSMNFVVPRLSLQKAFDLCIADNSLNVFSADIMLNSGVLCSEANIFQVVDHCNVHMLNVLIPRCRKWSPTEMLNLIKMSERDMPERLVMVKWIFQWTLDNGLPCTVQGSPEDIYSYQVYVPVVTRTGNVERACRSY